MIPDPNLEQVIREEIQKTSGDIYRSELEPICYLNEADTRNIQDLTGLEFCTNLIRLVTSSNQINDLSPLCGLDHDLEFLYLDHNNISDLSPLAGLTITAKAPRASEA